MKYYPVKFARSSSVVWSVWLPYDPRYKKGSVITYGCGISQSCPMVSEFSVLEWVQIYFSRYPKRLKKNIKPRA